VSAAADAFAAMLEPSGDALPGGQPEVARIVVEL
jgi:hypothetical protein